ncbi:MAG: ComEC/Rec2 family competence protein [Elusimicrobiaceae bacterium]|nr:ComEC/Rec2 family competence protein [Elusimicrobiaceae bacterium]
MHQSFYRRPLFLALVFYALGLAVFFAVFPPFSSQSGIEAGPAEIEGLVMDFPRPYGAGYTFALAADRLDGKPFSGLISVTVVPQSGGAEEGCAVFAGCAGPVRSGADSLKGAPAFKSRVRVLGELDEPRGDASAGGFSRKRYLAAKGIGLTLAAAEAAVTAEPSLFYRAVNAVRGHVLGVFNAVFTPAQSAVLGGITLGDRTGLTGRLAGVFRDSGAMHLLVASGSNVGFVTLGVYFLCGLFMVRRQYAVVPAVLCAGFYTVCAGADAPLLRALIMACAGSAGYLLGRESGILNGLLIAALGILAVDPRALLRADFIMSMLASAGIIMGLAAFPPDPKRRPLARYFTTVFFMSCFAQLLLLPVLALYFQRISLAAAVSNLLLVPLAGVLMFCGFLAAGLALLPFKFPFFASAAVTALAADIFLELADFFAGLPVSCLWVRSPGWGVTALYYCVVFTLLNFRLVKAGVFPWKRIAGSGMAAFLLWLAWPARDSYYISSARGGGIVVFRAAAGATALSGSGCDGTDAARAVLAAGRKRVNVFLAVSLAPGYCGGLAELDRVTPVENVILPYGPLDAALERVVSGLKARGVSVRRLWPGETAVFQTSAGAVRVTAQKGRARAAGTGEYYSLPFYSGNAASDALSYRVAAGGAELVVGAKNRSAGLIIQNTRAQ